MTTITDEQIKTLNNHIQNSLHEYCNEYEEGADSEIEIEFEVSDELYFYATLLVSVKTTDSIGGSYGGYAFEELRDVDVTDVDIDFEELFGIYDENVDKCYLTTEQRDELIKSIEQ